MPGKSLSGLVTDGPSSRLEKKKTINHESVTRCVTLC